MLFWPLASPPPKKNPSQNQNLGNFQQIIAISKKSGKKVLFLKNPDL